MQKTHPYIEIRQRIKILEAEKIEQGQILKADLYELYESLKPINLIKKTMKEISTSPYLVDNLIDSSIGLASGYVSKKLLIGKSDNVLKRIFGNILQFGIGNMVAQHPEVIKSAGVFIFQHIFKNRNKEIIKTDE